MATKLLKRVLRREGVTGMLETLVDKNNLEAGVFLPNGKRLAGREIEGPGRPVVFDGEVIGEVRGGEEPTLLDHMLDLLMKEETVRRALNSETLNLYSEVNLLYRITQKVADRVPPEEIGNLIIEGACQLIDADRASVMLLDDSGKFLEILAAAGDDIPVGTKVPSHLSIFGPVLESGQAEVVTDVASDKRIEQGVIKIASLICAPLKVINQIIGLLFVTSEEPRNYEAGDLHLITALATQAAAAIETTRLILNLEEKVAIRTRELQEANETLQEELNEAAEYVRSLLPPRLTEGPILTDWRFIPSTSLGGDSFGHHWLDDDHFVMYLLDVSGHGVGAALLSVSVMNVLRSGNLPNTDFSQPDQVLSALNNAFPMEEQNGRYFTMWYGVYDRKTRLLSYASGGHPPALLIHGWAPDEVRVEELQTPKMFIGGLPGLEYKKEEIEIQGPCRFYLFCDGVFEVTMEEDKVWEFEEFEEYFSALPREEESVMDRLLAHARKLNGDDVLDDDFSILEVLFQ